MKDRFPTRQNVLRDGMGVHVAPTAAMVAADVDPQLPLVLKAVVGINEPPAPMAAAELAGLGDVFTREVILKGKYPLTLDSLVEAVDRITDGTAYPLRSVFMVAEGGQFRIANPTFETNARFVFIWRKDNTSPADVLLSTVAVTDSEVSLLQLIAWSDADRSFHFFERKEGVWGWAGNSFHALTPPSRGRGPFDSHINGGLVMKELKFPWAHWHSMSASIPSEAIASNSDFHTSPLFHDIAGAELLEPVVKKGISRWTSSRLAKDTATGVVENLPDYFRQLVTATSANLTSSSLEFNRARGNIARLPSSFFLDVDGIEFAVTAIDPFSDIIPSAKLEVSGDHYAEAVDTLQIQVPSENKQTAVSGDTHFCFLVPERAFEDLEVAKQLLAQGFISPRLLLSLLMVDFSNPISSERRSALIDHCPDTLAQDGDLSAIFVASCAKARMPGSVEDEFLTYWEEADLLGRIRRELANFFVALQDAVMTQEGVKQVLLLAESRKRRFRQRLLDEFDSTTSWIGVADDRVYIIDKHGIIGTENELIG